MRELLFRGKRTDNGEWVEGFYLNRSNDKEDIHCIMEMFPATVGKRVVKETVGQYTGLMDRKGNRIFEGDIVKYDNVDTNIYYIGYTGGVYRLFYPSGCYGVSVHNNYSYIEVIGNIHDNPNLLKCGAEE